MLRDFRCGSNLKLSLAVMGFEFDSECIKCPEAAKQNQKREQLDRARARDDEGHERHQRAQDAHGDQLCIKATT